MIESLFPHLRLDQLWDATWETLYMTGIAGLATLVLGIVLGVLLFLTSKGQLWQNRAVYSLISTKWFNPSETRNWMAPEAKLNAAGPTDKTI